LPVLATLEQEFEGLAVVTVCIGSGEEARDALREAGVSLLTLIDDDLATCGAYRANTMPTTYLIDANGVIQMSETGYGNDTLEQLRSEIQRLLEK
jgi:hypothetical protein